MVAPHHSSSKLGDERCRLLKILRMGAEHILCGELLHGPGLILHQFKIKMQAHNEGGKLDFAEYLLLLQMIWLHRELLV